MADPDRDAMPPPSKERRWDIDERGHGVADARRLAPRIGELQRNAEASDWVAEQPDAHLWPHLQHEIDADGSPWSSGRWRIETDGTLAVDLVHRPPLDDERGRAELTADLLRLIGVVIEGSTYIEFEERRADSEVVVDVLTGMLDDQTPFKGHGHTIRFRARIG
jgi:hypothetical protein